MSYKHQSAAVWLLIGLLAGCATSWVRVDDVNRQYRNEFYRVTLPPGWYRYQSGDSLLLSKDGLDLQRILIQYHPHDQAFETLEKPSSVAMLPSELAELTIAEIKAGQEGGLPSMVVLDNVPMEIAGRGGFSLHLRFKTDAGLRIELLACGFVDERGFYLLMYRAPTLHYFDRDRQVFESVTESFRI
jgi:hypothetical protein